MNTIQALITRAEAGAKAQAASRLSRPLARVAIGSRWKPGHRITIDTGAGTFEEVNPPLAAESEALVQRALIDKPAGYPLAWWVTVSLCGLAAIVLATLPQGPL